jgi:hypothetical protein
LFQAISPKTSLWADTPRHGQDELQHPAPRQADGLQVRQVVRGEQPSVGHGDDAFDGEALDDLLDHPLEGCDLGGVALKDLVIQGQALGRLNHPQHDLACDDAFLGHAVAAYITLLLGQPGGADGGHVVEDHGQILIHQRAQQTGHDTIDLVFVIHQGVHGTQQVLVINQLGHSAGKGNGLQPAQHAQLGVRVTKAIDHHHAHQRLDIDGVAGLQKDFAQALEAQ